jgi:hypothetical protein
MGVAELYTGERPQGHHGPLVLLCSPSKKLEYIALHLSVGLSISPLTKWFFDRSFDQMVFQSKTKERLRLGT